MIILVKGRKRPQLRVLLRVKIAPTRVVHRQLRYCRANEGTHDAGLGELILDRGIGKSWAMLTYLVYSDQLQCVAEDLDSPSSFINLILCLSKTPVHSDGAILWRN
jgi:hypothetical protein